VCFITKLALLNKIGATVALHFVSIMLSKQKPIKILALSPQPVRCSQHAPKFIMVMISVGCKCAGLSALCDIHTKNPFLIRKSIFFQAKKHFSSKQK